MVNMIVGPTLLLAVFIVMASGGSENKISPKIEKLLLPQLLLGEGPHWKVENESLYLVDINGKTIYRYHPSSGEYYSVTLDYKPGFVVPVEGEDDQFMVGGGLSLYLVEWDGVSDEAESVKLLDLVDEPDGNRINDGKCDPTGRLWFGTMGTDMTQRKAALYSYTKKEGLRTHYKHIGVSNGLAWDLKKSAMYHIDTATQDIYVMDYNTNGVIGNRTPIFNFKENGLDSFPDGTTIDSEGKLWTACFFGSRVINVDPETKKNIDEIKIPTKLVTSAAWGGSNLTELYITTGGVNNDLNDVFGDDPNGGLTYKVTGLSAHGLPMTPFKLN